jgi:hypothetical protein
MNRRSAIGNPSASSFRAERSQGMGQSPEMGLTLLSNDLGLSVDDVAIAIIAAVESHATLSNDPSEIKFQSVSATGTQVKSVTLSAGTPTVVINGMTTEYGYNVANIQFAASGNGSVGDDAVVRVEVGGIAANPVPFLLSSAQPHYEYAFNRTLTQAHTFSITCPGLTGSDTVEVQFVAIGKKADKSWRAHKRAEYAAIGGDIRQGYTRLSEVAGQLANKGLSQMKNLLGAKVAASKASAAGPFSVTSQNINPLGSFINQTNK